MSKHVLTGLATLICLTDPAYAEINCKLNSGVTDALSQRGVCSYDVNSGAYSGSPIEQAKCLLRPVFERQTLGKALMRLPDPLEALIGAPSKISIAKLEAYITSLGIGADKLGGSLSRPLSTTVAYFTIHDTSAPAYKAKFPADINKATWKQNQLYLGHKNGGKAAIANVMTNRIGGSITMADFSQPQTATKFELCRDRETKAGRFVHVENLQPRIDDPRFGRGNAAKGPMPGLTNLQYQRLALVYVAASVRRGVWLIPAFHAVIDKAYADGHDDPQNFDLVGFASAVSAIIKATR